MYKFLTNAIRNVPREEFKEYKFYTVDPFFRGSVFHIQPQQSVSTPSILRCK